MLKELKKIIIDCDPGIDDAVAIIVALSNRKLIDVIGITTTSGNVGIDYVTQNVLDIINLCDRNNISVAKGSSKPLKRKAHKAPHIHGEKGLGNITIDKSKHCVHKLDAVEFLKNSLEKEKLTIVAIGPLTNIAKLLIKYPHVKTNIKEIIFMGGSIDGGNITPVSEFNFAYDPEAAKIVINSGLNLTMAGLGIGQFHHIDLKILEKIKNGNKIQKFVYDIINFYIKNKMGINEGGQEIYDLNPIIYLIKPNIFKVVKYHVDVETNSSLCDGMCIVDRRNIPDNLIKKQKPNINIMVSGNRKKFTNIFIESIIAYKNFK